MNSFYPHCDYCNAQLNYEPWHGSGILDGELSRHIHACHQCRSMLPGNNQMQLKRTAWQDDHRLCRIVVNSPGLNYGSIDERQEYICSQVRRDMATKWGARTPWDCLHEQQGWHSQFHGNTSREVHSHTPAPYEWSSESRYQRFEQLLTAQRCHWLDRDDDVLPF